MSLSSLECEVMELLHSAGNRFVCGMGTERIVIAIGTQETVIAALHSLAANGLAVRIGFHDAGGCWKLTTQGKSAAAELGDEA